MIKFLIALALCEEGFLGFGPKDTTQDDANGVALGAAQAYISQEEAALTASFNQKYDAAQAQIADQTATLAKNSALVDAKATTVETSIQAFNQQGQDKINSANNGATSKVAPIATQVIPQKTSPLVYVGAAVAAYFIFFKKGR